MLQPRAPTSFTLCDVYQEQMVEGTGHRHFINALADISVLQEDVEFLTVQFVSSLHHIFLNSEQFRCRSTVSADLRIIFAPS